MKNIFVKTLIGMALVFMMSVGIPMASAGADVFVDEVTAVPPVTTTSTSVPVYFFWAEGCPHCEATREFLDQLNEEHYYNVELNIRDFEVSKDAKHQELLSELCKEWSISPVGVPVTVVGVTPFSGFNVDYENKFRAAITSYVDEGKTDEVDVLIESFVATIDTPTDPIDLTDPRETCDDGTTCPITPTANIITLPWFGAVDTTTVSLPMLTVMIGTLDGFNPCAMWTLVFLISLLLGMKDKKRMWILGSAFIVGSGAVYFLFMAAWLNFLLFIGMVATIRLLIGVTAFGFGIYNFKEFFFNKDAACKITGNEKRQKVFSKLRALAHEPRFWLAFIGILALAFAVNLVELLCSAGFPAVYTQVLTLNHLPSWQYYLYLLLYIFFFMIDDLIVFFVSMATLQATGITTRYTRVSQFIGGFLMTIIGILLLFKPEWLMWG